VRVLSHKSAHKEITEAYGARRKIFETLRGLGYFDGEYEKKTKTRAERTETTDTKSAIRAPA
jgi:Holliday junction resolvasome RuvABC DNA-binding subunit